VTFKKAPRVKLADQVRNGGLQQGLYGAMVREDSDASELRDA